MKKPINSQTIAFKVFDKGLAHIRQYTKPLSDKDEFDMIKEKKMRLIDGLLKETIEIEDTGRIFSNISKTMLFLEYRRIRRYILDADFVVIKGINYISIIFQGQRWIKRVNSK